MISWLSDKNANYEARLPIETSSQRSYFFLSFSVFSFEKVDSRLMKSGCLQVRNFRKVQKLHWFFKGPSGSTEKVRKFREKVRNFCYFCRNSSDKLKFLKFIENRQMVVRKKYRIFLLRRYWISSECTAKYCKSTDFRPACFSRHPEEGIRRKCNCSEWKFERIQFPRFSYPSTSF